MSSPSGSSLSDQIEPSFLFHTISKKSSTNSTISSCSTHSAKSFEPPYFTLNSKSNSFVPAKKASQYPVKTPPATNVYDTLANSAYPYPTLDNISTNVMTDSNPSNLNNPSVKPTWAFKPANNEKTLPKPVGYNGAFSSQANPESVFECNLTSSSDSNESTTQNAPPFTTKQLFSPFSDKQFDYRYSFASGNLPTVIDSAPGTGAPNTSYNNTAPSISPDSSFFTSPFSSASKPNIHTDFRSLNSSSSTESQAISKFGVDGSYESLVAELAKKDQLIETLKEHNLKCTNETTHLRKLLLDNNNNVSTIHHVDPAIETMFKKLSSLTQEQDHDIVHLKNQLQAALAMLNTNGDDTMARRLVARLESLTEENTQLSKMLSFGRAQQKNVEIGMLKYENNALKLRIKDYQTVCTELNKNLEALSGNNNGNSKKD
ncbi:hypothetical protein NADFUDRAFT_39817 [Nadsonia fulvescens var. elongata DSM 6958]|uniref:Uncharacterized protein n=1 Tax=Nadsonia fulvescens var. elongata DSM 6958 TaxID=857566 RepID=A0A1E3PSP0_9ASCO|nr:hypothetical protein NADFUDRAFT_39817 [Nadsonia fulvescens var. elongata DSM 6958]